MPTHRLSQLVSNATSQGRKLLVPYIMGGDPDVATTPALLDALVAGGADIIELGFPFSDPMADGPTIQAAALRALEAKTRLADILQIVTDFRTRHADVPLVLMGYANPLYSYGLAKFCEDAAKAGMDGLLIVDLPPEEADELSAEADKHGLSLIRLVTPTTDATRLTRIIQGASGYLYYVSITGVTGTASADVSAVEKHLAMLKQHTDLPVAIGFGIRTPEQAAEMARYGEAVVVGSALVEHIQQQKASGADIASITGSVTQWLKAFRDTLDC